MGKAGGGALLMAGIFLVLFGWLIQSDILEWLLNIIGFIVIGGGVIVGIIGLIKLFSGGQSGAESY